MAGIERIHPTALIDSAAQLDSSVSVGPYAVIGPHVEIGAGTTIGAHCVVEGHTRIGCDNRIFQFASLGAQPQDKKYARSEEHTSELQSPDHLVCRLLLEKKKNTAL